MNFQIGQKRLARELGQQFIMATRVNDDNQFIFPIYQRYKFTGLNFGCNPISVEAYFIILNV